MFLEQMGASELLQKKDDSDQNAKPKSQVVKKTKKRKVEEVFTQNEIVQKKEEIKEDEEVEDWEALLESPQKSRKASETI